MSARQTLGGKGWLLAYPGDEGLMVERLDLCNPPQQLLSGDDRPDGMAFEGDALNVATDPAGRWIAMMTNHGLTFVGTSGDKKGHTVPLPLPDEAMVLAWMAHSDGKSVFALTIMEKRAYEAAATESVLYRIAVPAPLWHMPPLIVKEDATHCPTTEASRLQQDFKHPEKPSALPLIARLVPTKEMTTNRYHGVGRDGVCAPGELYFSREGNLHALYNYDATGAELNEGVAVWDPQANKLLRARVFWGYGGEHPLRLHEGWGTAGEPVTNLLTGTPFPFTSNGVDASGDVVIRSDPDKGELYRLAMDNLEHYSADGRRLPDIELAGVVFDFVLNP
jgi:hypothetical protein